MGWKRHLRSSPTTANPTTTKPTTKASPQVPYQLFFYTSRDDDYTTSLDNLFQCLTGNKDVPLISIDIRLGTGCSALKELKPRIEMPPSSPGLVSVKSNKEDKSLAKSQEIKLCVEMRSEKYGAGSCVGLNL